MAKQHTPHLFVDDNQLDIQEIDKELELINTLKEIVQELRQMNLIQTRILKCMGK